MKAAGAKSAKSEFGETFAGLKKILEAHLDQLVVKADTPANFYLETRKAVWKGRPIFFAAVRMGKAYVSFHLMPLYGSPDLVATMSPELKKRMQGKSCFNFKKPDAAAFAELAQLTKAGLKRFSSEQAIKRGSKSCD